MRSSGSVLVLDDVVREDGGWEVEFDGMRDGSSEAAVSEELLSREYMSLLAREVPLALTSDRTRAMGLGELTAESLS